jgi:hypothetical protein
VEEEGEEKGVLGKEEVGAGEWRTEVVKQLRPPPCWHAAQRCSGLGRVLGVRGGLDEGLRPRRETCEVMLQSCVVVALSTCSPV